MRNLGFTGLALFCIGTCASSAQAGMRCAIPSVFNVQIERRSTIEPDGPGLVSVARSGAPSGLAPRDRIRQANGQRVDSCDDIERVASEALAKGLALLLGVERDGVFVAVAVTQTSGQDERGTAAAGDRAGHPNGAAAGAGTTAAPAEAPATAEELRAPAPSADERVAAPAGDERPPHAHADVGSPAKAVVSLPEARREVVLPSPAEGSPTLRESAAAASRSLAAVDEVARLAVPFAVYDRRLQDAERAVAALTFDGTEADATVRAAVEEVVAYHRTARDIRRTKIDTLAEQRGDRRASSASGLPYFSDSRVPEWVATYPFLTASLVKAPREIRMPLPGEVAGRWDPDRALELLWSQARERRTRLAEWAAGV